MNLSQQRLLNQTNNTGKTSKTGLPLKPFEPLMHFGDLFSAFEPETPNEEQSQKNQRAIIDLVEITAIAEAALLASQTPFETFNDALDVREILFNEIDRKANETNNDELFAALDELRLTISKTIAEQAELPKLMTLPIKKTMPTLPLIYDLYEDLTHEEKIIQRNHISRPGFMLASTTIKVLST